MMTLLFLPALVILGAVSARRLYVSHTTGTALVVLAYLAAATMIEPASFPLGTLTIYIEDVLGLALIGIAAARLTLDIGRRKLPAGWLMFFAATLTAFAVGASAYGVKPAGVEFRGYFYLSAAALYCSSFPLGSSQLASMVSVWLGWFVWSARLPQLPGWPQAPRSGPFFRCS